MKKKLLGLLAVGMLLSGCAEATVAEDNKPKDVKQDTENTKDVVNDLIANQPTPTDIEYSLERYNLIKRAYWVNGMRDKANSLPSPIADMPLGYIVLFTESGDVIGQFTVDGKVSSLNSFLTPSTDYERRRYYDIDSDVYNIEIPDVDGSFGENDMGIFFFTTDGKYIEWTGTYLYSDIPFNVKNTVLGD